MNDFHVGNACCSYKGSIFFRDSRTGERRARMKTTPLEKSETRREERGDFHVVV